MTKSGRIGDWASLTAATLVSVILLMVAQEEDHGLLQIALIPSHRPNSAVDTLHFNCRRVRRFSHGGRSGCQARPF